MQKSDFMVKRDFGRGNFRKLNSAQLPAPTIRPVESGPMRQPSSSARNESAVRCGPVAPPTDTAGNVLGFEATNPDSRSPRSWSDYLRGCLEFLGCK